MAAAVEQHHDEHGIAWPRSLAPYDVHVVAIESAGPEAVTLAGMIEGELEQAGFSVLLDDRDRRPGEKFADADLIGCPLRVTVGKKAVQEGAVDLLARATRDEEACPAGEVVARARTLWETLP
jgi:prolyl-tRNA synthetase